MLQPLTVLKWKWEHIFIDFIIRLLRVQSGFNVFCVIVNRLSRTTYFLYIKNTNPTDQLGKLYVQEIVRLHVVCNTHRYVQRYTRLLALYVCIYAWVSNIKKVLTHSYVRRLHAHVCYKKGKIIFSYLLIEIWLSLVDPQSLVRWSTHPYMVNAFEY